MQTVVAKAGNVWLSCFCSSKSRICPISQFKNRMILLLHTTSFERTGIFVSFGRIFSQQECNSNVKLLASKLCFTSLSQDTRMLAASSSDCHRLFTGDFASTTSFITIPPRDETHHRANREAPISPNREALIESPNCKSSFNIARHPWYSGNGQCL